MAFIVGGSVTLISALVSAGYAVVGLRAARGETRTPSMYALARGMALLVVVGIAILSGSVVFETSAAVAMVLAQGFDSVIGLVLRDRMRTVGPAGTVVLNAAALAFLVLTNVTR